MLPASALPDGGYVATFAASDANGTARPASAPCASTR